MLNISVIQTTLYWENPTANLAHFEEKIAQLPSGTDLIVLPEMFTTGFSMNSQQLAEGTLLHTHRWLALQAKTNNAMVIGSYMVQDQGNYYNRVIAMEPNGVYHVYNKRHLFRMGNEHQHYSPGTTQTIIKWRGAKIMPLVCYDLRFPVWSRNVNQAYHILIYMANWPAARAHAWNTLLQARAIENQAYVIGCNRIGPDGNQVAHSGNSKIINYLGEIIADASIQDLSISGIVTIDALQEYRNAFPAYLDADSFGFTD
jgi:omega-amidase